MEEDREVAEDAQSDASVTGVDGDQDVLMETYRHWECWVRAEDQSYGRSETQSHSSWTHLDCWMAWRSQSHQVDSVELSGN